MKTDRFYRYYLNLVPDPASLETLGLGLRGIGMILARRRKQLG